MPGPRNRFGVIDQANSVRTVNGVAFVSWMSFHHPSGSKHIARPACDAGASKTSCTSIRTI